MPASIAHMLIARQARRLLSKDDNPKIAQFAEEILNKHSHYMDLGSLGPDLPYFGWRSLFDSNKPRGVDHWSYQLHSKCPNVFPLKMIELVWRESDPTKKDWEDSDRCKLSFLCGYLTHMAADQVIHPVVNAVAGGSYCQRIDVRKQHRDCEIYQDLYLLSQYKDMPTTDATDGQLTKAQFRAQRLHSWCNPKLDAWSTSPFSDVGGFVGQIFDAWWMLKKTLCPPPCPIEFIYFLQRAFVDAHAVTPDEDWTERWIKSLQKALWLGRILPWSWYNLARRTLFTVDGFVNEKSKAYAMYIDFRELATRRGRYDHYVEEAIKLAVTYIRAAYELSRAPRLDDDLRRAFQQVVVNADLGVPLELHIPEAASENYPNLARLVEEKWAKALRQ